MARRKGYEGRHARVRASNERFEREERKRRKREEKAARKRGETVPSQKWEDGE